MKTCKKCNHDKPIDSFTVDTRYRDGRYPWCAECRRAWRQARKDKQRELHRAWSNRNREHVREMALENYYRHKDQYSQKRREYDREKWHTDPRVRNRKNAQKLRLYHTNPAYRRRHLETSRICVHRRRARIKGMSTHFTQQEWRDLCDKYGNRCLKCGKQGEMTPDHIVPISRGGSNDISNIQPLCLACNLHKHAKTADYRPLKQSALEWGDD